MDRFFIRPDQENLMLGEKTISKVKKIRLAAAQGINVRGIDEDVVGGILVHLYSDQTGWRE